ncbi:family 20 glycosylhydrolase [Rouxiella badensis]|jgi:hexosaminidase|uniref:beta-N-acetylhexosaminidase n=1 Tax=Rouxiella badensis TaxID=1646377 RepID=A0A1X0WJK9_9GAMM|nr:family 20 glycosylhydrolase [Rouxiella badensis]ORJ26957.1 beta-N-acetylhexosaminidase [Rouxiella badensis]WAT05219.1 family 20 glycosylhydrolase [Rouxiella badensis]
MLLPFRRSLFASSFLLAITSSAFATPAGNLPLMPWPQQVEVAPQAGKWRVDNRLSVAVSGDNLGPLPQRWRERIELQTGWTLQPQPTDATQSKIQVVIKHKVDALPKPDSDESYDLEVTPQGAIINANTRFGAIHGMETLLQLLQNDGENTFLPLVRIHDNPRFAWRGVLLDSARHFLPVSTIKRQLDGMAAAKLNVLHWHLTDDQGWRFASEHYPKLQQLASDGEFYTVAEMKDVVAYATSLGIRVVPEIDMPGHASAIAVAYPELISAPGPFSMQREWGVHEPTLDPSNEQVYKFADTLVGELAAIFPDPYLHIGGDEVKDTQWQNSTAIKAYMKKNHIADSHALQAAFNKRLQQILQKHHRHMVGWDEIFHPDLPKNIVIQSWQGPDSLGASAQQGYLGILSTGFYLDQPQSSAYHYRNEILPQPLGVDQNLAEGEKAQSWAFSMPRLKGSPVEGSFSLIEGKQGWRGFIDFKGKTRRALRDIVWQNNGQVSFAVDTWMGDTRPVLTLKDGKFDGYFVIGNARYPATGNPLSEIPQGTPPVVPDARGMQNILGGEAALWQENITSEILDLKLWPRGFVVAERLWSAEDVKDIDNMYQRLAKVDAWSAVSVGLQQHAETTRLMTRLANSSDITPLLTLSSALEPAQYYTRQHLKFKAGNYQQFEPLNRLVDALPAESNAVRQLDNQVKALLADGKDVQAARAIRNQLTLWRDNRAQVEPILAQNYVLKPVQPVAEQLSQLSVLGLKWLDNIQRGEHITAEERQKAQTQLDSAAQIQDELVIAAVYPLQRLLQGVK